LDVTCGILYDKTRSTFQWVLLLFQARVPQLEFANELTSQVCVHFLYCWKQHLYRLSVKNFIGYFLNRNYKL